MNDLQIFNNTEFGSIRTVVINGEPWFVGKDIAAALGYTDLSHCIVDHVDEEDRINSKTHGQTDPELGQRGTWLINESGLYSLTLSSKLPTAKKFKHWVTSEVLPTIRKHGAYMTPEVIERTLADPDFIIQLATTLKEERQARHAAELKLQEQQPLVDFANHVAATHDLIDIAEMAKLLADKGINIGRNRLFSLLRSERILMSGAHQNEPYQKYIDQGYFKTKEIVVGIGTGMRPKIKTYVTGTGQKFIYNLIVQQIAC